MDMRASDVASLLNAHLGRRGGADSSAALELAMLVCRQGGHVCLQVLGQWQNERDLTSEVLVGVIDRAGAVLRNTAPANLDEHDVGLISDGANGLQLVTNKYGERTSQVSDEVARAAWQLRYHAMQVDGHADELRKGADEMRAAADEMEGKGQ
jgi:hypothetical protein